MLYINSLGIRPSCLINFSLYAAKAYWIYSLPKCYWLSEKNFYTSKPKRRAKILQESSVNSSCILWAHGLTSTVAYRHFVTEAKFCVPRKCSWLKSENSWRIIFWIFRAPFSFIDCWYRFAFGIKNESKIWKMNTCRTPILVYNLTIHTRFK